MLFLDRFVLGPDRAGALIAAGLFVAASACGTTSPDPALEVTEFKEISCPDTAEQAAVCYRFAVVVAGSESGGTGSCDIVAVGVDGANMSTGARLTDLKLESGRTYEEVVVLPTPSRDDFDRWEPECEPTGEG